MSSVIALPTDRLGGALPRLLHRRRSTRHFAAAQAVDLPDVAAALRAALGSTVEGRRAVPSARAAYPVTATLVAGDVTGLPPGAYRYDPVVHTLTAGASGDHRPRIAAVTLDARHWLPQCPALVLLSADLRGVAGHFADQPRDHVERFVWLEAGHVSQNVYLWAAENGFGTVLVAGLDDARTPEADAVVPGGHLLLALMGLGVPAGPAVRPKS